MKRRLLTIYNFILVTSLLFVGITIAKTAVDFLFFVFLLPVLLYFLVKVIGVFPLNNALLKKVTRYKKFLLVYSVGFCLFLLALQIKTITSAGDVVVVALFAPMFVGFVLEITEYVKRKEVHLEEITAITNEEHEEEHEEVETIEGVPEVSRRKFFKTLAGAGLGMFLFYIVKPHKAEAAFFGSIPGPGTIAIKDSNGDVIDPAVKLPTDGYGIANVFDDAFSVSVLYHYYGFTKAGGFWYILRVGSDNSYKYIKGTTDYQTNWTNRESITPYDTFGNTF